MPTGLVAVFLNTVLNIVNDISYIFFVVMTGRYTYEPFTRRAASKLLFPMAENN